MAVNRRESAPRRKFHIKLAGEGPRFARFCAVGILNTVVNYAVYLLLWGRLGVPYLVAGPIGFMSGAITGFFLNRAWTFSSSVAIGAGLARYLSVQVVSLGSHWATQWFAGEGVGVPEAWTQLAGIAVSTFVNFFLLRRFVFNNSIVGQDDALGSSR